MKPDRRYLSVMMLTLMLLAQGVSAFAPMAHHFMCGMEGDSAMVGSMSDCGHPAGSLDIGCDQCSQCNGGHCFAWALPVTSVTSAPMPADADQISLLSQRAPLSSPAGIYRPPRLHV